MKNHYNRRYSKESRASRKRRMPFYNRLAGYILPDDRVMDIGCGNGLLALRSKFKSWTGVDFSNVAIAQAKSFVPAAKWICQDIFAFLKKPPAYDVVVMTEILEHLEKDTDLLKMIRKGSRVIISVPNMEEEMDGKPVGYPVHQRVYNSESLVKRYNTVKFSEVFVFENRIIGVGVKK